MHMVVAVAPQIRLTQYLRWIDSGQRLQRTLTYNDKQLELEEVEFVVL